MNKKLLAVALLSASVFSGAPALAQTDDAEAISAAAKACKANDFKSLFNLIIEYPAVRIAYSAPEIELLTADATSGVEMNSFSSVARAEYHDFPIMLVDYGFAYGPSVMKDGEINPDYDRLDVQLDQGQNEGWSVSWEKARYLYTGTDADEDSEFGTITAYYGDSGMLYFEPTEDCWELRLSTIIKQQPGDRPAK